MSHPDASDSTRPVVAVIGSGSLNDGDPRAALAERLGRVLVDAGYRIACGGLDGVMRRVCRGAHRSDEHRPGTTIGILPGSEPGAANPWVDVAVPTGLSHARNTIVARSEAVVALGGGAGTLSEISFAWIMDRLIVAFEVDGWSGRLAGERLDERDRLPSLQEDRIFGVSTPDDVVDCLDARLEDYHRARGANEA
jgi:uncharacterized protein (TIGR00725 family)